MTRSARWNPSHTHVVACVGCVVAALLVLEAARGDLDVTFGTGGTVITDWGVFVGRDDNESINDLVVAADGKIVAAGTIAGTGVGREDSEMAIARYDADGSLDLTFGGTGKVRDRFDANSINRATGVALQADHRIVVAGWTMRDFFSLSSGDFALARYNPHNGSLDTTFGVGGHVITDFFGSEDKARAVVVEPGSQRIVAVGSAGAPAEGRLEVALARYLPDGTLDETFGSGGRVTTGIATPQGPHAEAFGAVLQPDQKIVVAGSAGHGFRPRDFAIARYLSDGRLDPSFGAGGVVLTDIGERDQAGAVALQSDGHIVVAGTDGAHVVVLRYNADGTLDSTFGVAGSVVLPDKGAAADVTIAPSGNILVAGSTQFGSSIFFLFTVISLEPDGTPDTTFGPNGKVTVSFAPAGNANALVIQSDGKILAGGSANYRFSDVRAVFTLARFLGFSTDVTPPTLTVPGTIVVDGTSPGGATVTYAVSVVDDADPNPHLVCSPPSGSVFPLGLTTVTCTATDSAGNVASATFDVIVRDANLQLGDAVVLIEGWPLRTLGMSLLQKLEGVRRSDESGPLTAACGKVKSFLNEVRAQAGKGLTQVQAAELTLRGARIEAVMGCDR